MDWNLIGLWSSGLLTGAGFGFVAGWLARACLNRRFGER